MPLNPVEQAASTGIELPPELLSLLAKVAATLHATLGTHLDKVYPVNAPASSRQPVSQTQESET
jgi:membrane protein